MRLLPAGGRARSAGHSDHVATRIGVVIEALPAGLELDPESRHQRLGVEAAGAGQPSAPSAQVTGAGLEDADAARIESAAARRVIAEPRESASAVRRRRLADWRSSVPAWPLRSRRAAPP
jgi:hypothetical protein